jgi:DNA-binding MarR family transcriptional regulator
MSDWDDVGYVISSRYRVAVMRELSNGPRTPTKIAEGCDTGIANVSRALQGLREHSLVELLVSEDRKKGRVYGFTERGDRIWQQIDSQNLADQS